MLVLASTLLISLLIKRSLGYPGHPLRYKLVSLSKRNKQLVLPLSAPDDWSDQDDAVTEERILQRKVSSSEAKRSRGSGPEIGVGVVPAFVGVWAAGYLLLAFVETQGPGLGDLGGTLGVAFACVLLLSLVAAAFYEVLKPDTPGTM